jgi:DNA repair protein RadC
MKKFELKTLQTNFEAVKITKDEDAINVIRQFYGDDIEIFESCFILLLNNSNITIGYAKISQGGITGTVVDTRLIAKYAIESLATGVILCHNHPSGSLKPSEADISTTKKVKDGLKIFDIVLLDHIILTKDSYSTIPL